MTSWWWWVTLPRAIGRRFVGLSVLAVDGHVLLGLGPAAVLFPWAALIGGLWVGVQHPGFAWTFTESLALTVIALAVGTMSNQLGLLLTLGFALGDFFGHHTDWSGASSGGGSVFASDTGEGLLANPILANLIIVRVPLLIEYSLLLALAVGVPLGARGLAGSLAVRLKLPPGVHAVVTTALVAVTAFVLARFWGSAAPMVIRPVFTWTIEDGINQGPVPVEAIAPVQENIDWIGRTAALAVLGRGLLTWSMSSIAPRRLAQAEQAILAPIDRERTSPGPLRQIMQAILVACLAVLFLAGMIDDLWAAGVLAGVFFLARLSRSGLIPIPTHRWRAIVSRIPVLFRYGGVLLIMNGIAKAIIASSLNDPTTDRFQFLIWPVALAALLMAMATPETPTEQQEQESP